MISNIPRPDGWPINNREPACAIPDLGPEVYARWRASDIGATVTGIDASAAIIDAANNRAHRHKANVDFRVATAEQLPFVAEQFDAVTAISILCFVDGAAPALREIARVLRPGDRLVIGELGKWSTWAAGRRVRACLGSRLWRRGRFRTANELRNLAEQVGVVVKDVRGAIYYPRCSLAARHLSRCDPVWGRLTTIGAAFLALSAVKPGGGL